MPYNSKESKLRFAPVNNRQLTNISSSGCVACDKHKLNTVDYLSGLPVKQEGEAFVEVQFKNTRKGYYLNDQYLPVQKGDMVTVEAQMGHDVGEVTLTGQLVARQIKKLNYRHPNGTPFKLLRLSTESDLERYHQAKSLEVSTMIESRQIAKRLNLDMKIGDVEYQGDGLKAIFYYIADGRVDFRQLIRDLAAAFHIRVEMKQIGARQEAGRIGGIGPCGRQLCCSGWMTNFVSVGTHAARLQDISLNPQKLAGQCAKLKCCLNFEVDNYLEAQEELPPRDIDLHSEEGDFRFFKVDVLSKELTYRKLGQKGHEHPIYVTLTADRVFEIIELNRQDLLPSSLLLNPELTKNPKQVDILSNESIERFDNVIEQKEEKSGVQRRSKRTKRKRLSESDNLSRREKRHNKEKAKREVK